MNLVMKRETTDERASSPQPPPPEAERAGGSGACGFWGSKREFRSGNSLPGSLLPRRRGGNLVR